MGHRSACSGWYQNCLDRSKRDDMRRKVEFLTMGIILVSSVVFSGHFLGQTKDSSRLPITGGDGISKDFKLSGPLGVFQLPRRPVKASKTIRALLPRGAKVRLLQNLTLNPADFLVVYDSLDTGSSSPFMDIRYPAVLIVRANHVVERVSLRRRTNDDPDWVFLEAGEVRLLADLGAIALAFRSMGDGSASLYLVIAPQGQNYHIVLNKIAGQGRLRADREGNLELWDANFGEECVWCNHDYTIFTYRWRGLHLARVRKAATCRTIDPDAMTDKPIEAVESLKGEYEKSERERMQEQHLLKVKLPADLDGTYRGKLGQQEIVMQVGGAEAEQWNKCDFRDPARARGRRYPIVAMYVNQRTGADVVLAGVPVSRNRIRMWEYHGSKRTHDTWSLSITRSRAEGLFRRFVGHNSGLPDRTTAVSLKRISREFYPYFVRDGGYDW